jgi:hypothetical protein
MASFSKSCSASSFLSRPFSDSQSLSRLASGTPPTAELASPKVVRRLAEAVLAAQAIDRPDRLGFSQEANDLLFAGD